MVVNNIKTFLKMKNNCWLSIEKSVIKILFFFFFVDENEWSLKETFYAWKIVFLAIFCWGCCIR